MALAKSECIQLLPIIHLGIPYSVQFRTEYELETLFYYPDFTEDADSSAFQISTCSKMTGLCFICMF